MQEQIGTVSKEVETQRKKKQKEMLKFKDIVTEMKNAFGGIISRLHMAEGGISEFEDMTIETSKTEKQREERLKKKKKSKENGTATKGVTYT